MRASDQGLTSLAARKTRSKKGAVSYTMPKQSKRLDKSIKHPDSNAIEKRILVIIGITLLVFLIFNAAFFMVFFDKSFYDKSFQKCGQYDELGVMGVRGVVDNLLRYLISENMDINKVEGFIGFALEEKAHLVDVRTLIHQFKVLGIIALVLFILILIRLNMLKELKPCLRRMLSYGSIITLSLLLIIFLLSLNFPSFFEGFHKALFPQGNYTFPADYLLIKLFPQQFFQDYAKKMFFHTAIMSLILLFLSSSSALAFNNPRRH